MAKKEPKTNAMRMLERAKIPFEVHRYECKEFIDGITIADMLNEPYERVFKTLVTEGKGGGYFVFVIPIDQELDLKKAAKAAKEELKPEVFIQYQGNEAIVADVIEKAKNEFVADGHRASSIKSVQVYLKPEEFAAYYVINQKFAGRVDLFQERLPDGLTQK